MHHHFHEYSKTTALTNIESAFTHKMMAFEHFTQLNDLGLGFIIYSEKYIIFYDLLT